MRFEIMPIAGTDNVSIVATDTNGSMYEDPAHANIPVHDAEMLFRGATTISDDDVRRKWTQIA